MKKTTLLTLAILAFAFLLYLGSKFYDFNKKTEIKEQSKSKIGTIVSKQPIIEDTTRVYQEALEENDKYYLQTYVQENNRQIHLRKNESVGVGWDTQFCPYTHEINGTYEYVESQKNIEIEKAKAEYKKLTHDRKNKKINLKKLNSNSPINL